MFLTDITITAGITGQTCCRGNTVRENFMSELNKY